MGSKAPNLSQLSQLAIMIGPAVAVAELWIFGLKGTKFESVKSTGAIIIGPAVAVAELWIFGLVRL